MQKQELCKRQSSRATLFQTESVKKRLIIVFSEAGAFSLKNIYLRIIMIIASNYSGKCYCMKLHYMGKYDLNPESIPAKPHKPNCVKFKEPEDSKELNKIATIISLAVIVAFGVPLFLIGHSDNGVSLGFILSLLATFPHEFLHAICFKEDVYLYTYLKKGMLFVVGSEDMSKSRFIFMSLLPSIVFGIIPFSIFLVNPNLMILGTFGTINLSFGAGDYLNVFNAVTQMPKGSRTYLHHFNSYRYMPED